MSDKREAIKVAYLLFLLLLVAGCERRTKASIEGNPPRFVLSGNGRLGALLIFGPEQEKIISDHPFDTTFAIWRIDPEQPGEQGAARVEDLGPITYGVVPAGYEQTKPEKGPAPTLIPGVRYRYWFYTVNAPSDEGYFEIRNGKAVVVSGP